jgi:hypothetical protein
MHSATNSTTPAARTAAQRAWDYLLNHTVPKLDRLGEAVAAIVSRFTQDEWGVHFQVEAWRKEFTDAWVVESGSSKVYYLHVGRVEFAFFRDAREATSKRAA